MRDAYAMHLHSVPSRFSNPAIPAPIRKNVFGALFFIRGLWYNTSNRESCSTTHI